MPDTIIDDLCNEFQTFVSDRQAGLSEYIGDYIADWAFAGNYEGVIAVNGDYELYLQVVVAIVVRCLNDPYFLDYIDPEIQGPRSRSIRGLVDPEGGGQLTFISKHVFQGVVFDLTTNRRKKA
jgi:hypothetical protein